MFKIPVHLKRQIFINKTQSEIFRFLVDFKNWNQWSPWLKLEKTCIPVWQGEPGQIGHSQSWDGQIIGSGRMTLEALTPDKKIAIQLEFFKPWRSKSKAFFDLTPQGDGTLVAWSMENNLPFFMYFFKSQISAYLGSDFMRGLRMLKECLETNNLQTEVEHKGVQAKEGFYFVGIRNQSSVENLAQMIPADFAKLNANAASAAIGVSTGQVCFCHKMDRVKNLCDYTVALTFSQAPTSVPAGCETGFVPKHQALLVEHWGPYRFIDNAWSAVTPLLRLKKKKLLKSISPYELHLTRPNQIKAGQEGLMRTEVVLPIVGS